MKNKIVKFFVLFFVVMCCNAFAQNGTWTWMNGASVYNDPGNFGTQGVASPTNSPPALYESVSFTDLQGNFWIFGGATNTSQVSSALWKFDPTTNMWTWMKGPSAFNQPGIYGTQGVASPQNNPGARGYGAPAWVDLQGNFWMFGGGGYDGFGGYGYMDDLWKYDVSTNEWTWMKGHTTNTYGSNTNGTLQVPSLASNPQPTTECTTTWTTSNGDLWMYGGDLWCGTFSSQVWRYTPSTNIWTWMNGVASPSIAPNYGTLNITSASNTPGGRRVYSHWKDTNGNLWVYGGDGTVGLTADMWEYDITTNLWTWRAGSAIPYDTMTFTQQCSVNGHPSARRENTFCWTDDCGHFWQYGGQKSTQFTGWTGYDDLWEFDPYSGNFKWVSGTGQLGIQPSYGTVLVPSPSNNPGGLSAGTPFKDAQGNFWMFGGWHLNTSYLFFSNAMWKYTPDPNCPGAGVVANISYQNTACANSAVQFSSGTTNPNFTYYWDFGDPFSSTDTSTFPNCNYVYTDTGYYSVTLIVSSNNSCAVSSDTAQLLIHIQHFSPQINIGNDTLICGTINFPLDAGPASSWSWNNYDSTQIITVNAPGTYWVTALDSFNCPSYDTISIAGVSLNLGPDIITCTDSVTIDAGNPGSSYLWSTGQTTQTITVGMSGNYFVTMTDTASGCVLSDTINVLLKYSPTTTFVLASSIVCVNDSAFTLTTGTPPGGLYSGTGVIVNQYFYPSVSGVGTFVLTYTYTDSLGCSGIATDTITVSPCVGIAETDFENNLFVFPNPTNGELTVQFYSPSKSEVTLELFNVSGQIIYKKEKENKSGNFKEKISLSTISDGIYYLRITDSGQTVSRKVIVEKTE
jgi:hypothetical protein